jgi:phosphoribosylformylglycinamidine synthase
MPDTVTAPSWERHVERAETEFPLRRFHLARMTDDELVACSKVLAIGLSLQEMKDARAYFHKRAEAGGDGRATDVELEALGQAWSEHCCYKSSKPVLAANVYGIAESKIVCREDAGIVAFDGDWCYAAKLESHNHPSAIEPYGGAATGIGGVLRDVVCMGAQPVALLDPLFFGPLDLRTRDLPPGVKHPRFLLGGVVAGIRDYGNRVGIPTVAGGITFHPGYTGNCLVNVGCLGVVKRDRISHSRAGGVGDVFVYLGNATGRDGIHGVSFASEQLTEKSEDASRSAVQVGDAILKEPLMHVTLEVIEKGLATGCKDFGGGGLSCVAGELAYDAGFGCHIELEKVPTKVPGMAPWEVWVSESQERMMLTCRPADVEKVLHIARKWDVPAFAIGTVEKEPVNHVTFDGRTVLRLDLAFSTGGPVYDRPTAPPGQRKAKPLAFEAPADLTAVLTRMMAHPAIMSKEWVIRQYDHEVRAGTVVKPLQGVIGHEGPGDAAVVKPVAESDKCLALSSDVNPRYMERDAYWGAASAIDETVRNLAAVGARVSSFCDNLNFGNPEKPERMRELYDATGGLGDMARVLDVPFSSGNVSLYNESQRPIPPTPTVMGIGVVSHFKHATTMDMKRAGNALFLVGKTRREFGGSVLLDLLGLDGDQVPRTDAHVLARSAEGVVSAIEAGFVRAAHDCSEGGIAVALAEMCFAGGLGAEVDVAAVAPELAPHEVCFSETNTRWILEVPQTHADAVIAHFGACDVPLARIGTVTDVERLHIHDGGDALIDADARELRHAWAHAFGRLMGVEAAA